MGRLLGLSISGFRFLPLRRSLRRRLSRGRRTKTIKIVLSTAKKQFHGNEKVLSPVHAFNLSIVTTASARTDRRKIREIKFSRVCCYFKCGNIFFPLGNIFGTLFCCCSSGNGINPRLHTRDFVCKHRSGKLCIFTFHKSTKHQRKSIKVFTFHENSFLLCLPRRHSSPQLNWFLIEKYCELKFFTVVQAERESFIKRIQSRRAIWLFYIGKQCF